MQEEIFEVFDKNWVFVGTEKRSVVHAKGLRHKGVYVLLFNSKGELLLQKRALSKKIAPGKWDFSCAEHLVPGETFEEAALRGLKEEIGVEADHVKFLFEMNYVYEYENGLKDNELNAVFECVFDGKFKADGEEVSEARFFPLEKVKAMLEENPEKFAPWVKEALPKYFEKKSVR